MAFSLAMRKNLLLVAPFRSSRFLFTKQDGGISTTFIRNVYRLEPGTKSGPVMKWLQGIFGHSKAPLQQKHTAQASNCPSIGSGDSGANVTLLEDPKLDEPLIFEAEVQKFDFGRFYRVSMPGLEGEDIWKIRFENKSLVIKGSRDGGRHTIFEDGGKGFWCVIPFDRQPPRIWVRMSRGSMKIKVEDLEEDSSKTEIIWY